MNKLSPSAISTFLKSPKLYYWRYVHKLTPDQKYPGVEPLLPSIQNFDHDKLFGTLWGEFVTNFYSGYESAADCARKQWAESWVPDKQKKQYADALSGLISSYYAVVSPHDGARTPDSSERHVENDLFHGYLDGMSAEGVIHECKSTSRSPSLSDQIWKVENSIQIKLYAVVTQARGVQVEFAFKDPPYQILRCPVRPISSGMRDQWEDELIAIYDAINGEYPGGFPCHPDGCCLTTKRYVSMCPYQALCDGVPGAIELFKARENDR